MRSRSKSMFHIFTLFALLASLLGSALTVTPVYAAGIVVTSNADDILVNLDANSTCDFREAIINANNDAATYTDCAAGLGTDTITFSADYIITLAGQLPVVTTTIIINGTGAGHTVIQANAAANTASYRVFYVASPGDLTLDSLTVQNGVCAGLCATDTTDGGGIYNNGTLTVTHSLIKGNRADASGGGIANNSFATLYVYHSAFLNNTATNNDGGGILNVSSSTVTIANTTFSGNHAKYGGGLTNNDARAYIYNTTFSGNSADYHGSAVSTYNSLATTVIYNTIMANNSTSEDCWNGNNDSSTLSGDHNIIETTTSDAASCASVTASTADPSLGSLTGSPAYFPLNFSSPATNAGNDAICAAAPINNTSQNGLTRPQGAHCDIGSYELKIYTLFLPFIRR